MKRDLIPIAPSQQAVNGAMDIYLDAHLTRNLSNLILGLEILRSANEAQIQAAIHYQHSLRSLTLEQIGSMLAHPPTGLLTVA